MKNMQMLYTIYTFYTAAKYFLMNQVYKEKVQENEEVP